MKELNYDEYYEQYDDLKEKFKQNKKNYKSKHNEKTLDYEDFHFDMRFYDRDDDLKEIFKELRLGGEIKTYDVELVKNIVKEKNIKKKIGVFLFRGFTVEITNYNSKKVFCIRRG